MLAGAKYSAIEALHDGRRFEIRALRPDDRADLLAAVSRTSGQQASWCDPAGGSPVQVRGSARLVASVAWPLATLVAKRTQRLHGVWD
jgi:hypothetical protein